MTLLGKCFTVVILLLSLAFMVLSLAVNATHRNWKDLVLGDSGFRAQIDQKTRENDQLIQEAGRAALKLAHEQAARRTALAALQTAVDSLTADLAASQKAVESLEAKTTELTQLDKSRAEDNQRLTADNNRLRQEIRKEQQDRDTIFAQALDLTNELNEIRGIRLELDKRNKQLVKDLTRYKEVVDYHGIKLKDPLDGAPPDRNGLVLAVNRPRWLVELSLGHDDGLRPGHLLDVTRGGRYIGKVRIKNANPNRATAEILPDYSQGIIQEKDRVDTTTD